MALFFATRRIVRPRGTLAKSNLSKKLQKDDDERHPSDSMGRFSEINSLNFTNFLDFFYHFLQLIHRISIYNNNITGPIISQLFSLEKSLKSLLFWPIKAFESIFTRALLHGELDYRAFDRAEGKIRKKKELIDILRSQKYVSN